MFLPSSYLLFRNSIVSSFSQTYSKPVPVLSDQDLKRLYATLFLRSFDGEHRFRQEVF